MIGRGQSGFSGLSPNPSPRREGLINQCFKSPSLLGEGDRRG